MLTSLYGRPFSNTDIYKTCLHEIGHALGLQGHSSTASDIMYPVLNANQTPYLKTRDRNTIMALYARSTEQATIAMRPYPPRHPRAFYGGYAHMLPIDNGWARGFSFNNTQPNLFEMLKAHDPTGITRGALN